MSLWLIAAAPAVFALTSRGRKREHVLIPLRDGVKKNCQESVNSMSRWSLNSTPDSDRIITPVPMKEFLFLLLLQEDWFTTCKSFTVCIPQRSKPESLRSASIFLKSCMVEHLKWARTSPSGTDSVLIGARQAASAYLYNCVIWRLSKGGKREPEKIAGAKLQKENFTDTFH